MAINTLLTVHFAKESIDTIQPMIKLATAMDAYLNVVGLCVPSPINSIISTESSKHHWSKNFYELLADTDKRVVELNELFEQQSKPAHAVTECQELGAVERVIAHHALYADLAVFPNQSITADNRTAQAFNGALFKSGIPVLILGGQPESIPPIKRVMIAWGSAPEASKAIRCSLPLFTDAEELRVVVVDSDPVKAVPRSADHMSTYLRRHGYNASVAHLPGAGVDIAETLITHAQEIRADLIVMGAYGHSRLREWLLGGTTRRMLSEAEMPVFMAH